MWLGLAHSACLSSSSNNNKTRHTSPTSSPNPSLAHRASVGALSSNLLPTRPFVAAHKIFEIFRGTGQSVTAMTRQAAISIVSPL